MIIGVLSDTHLDSPTLLFQELLAVQLGRADVIVHAGDHTGPRVVDHLEFADPRPYYGVAGNMDVGELAQRLPREIVVELAGFRVGIIHGWGSPEGMADRVAKHFESAPDLVIFGHSHTPIVQRIGPTLFVNPGSAFDKRWAPYRSVALIELCEGGPHARIVDLGK